jgi:trehalose/maltose hydrolase-like predicted phosphorylase
VPYQIPRSPGCRQVNDEAVQTFEAIVLDWDGTIALDRRADASQLRARIEEICSAGVHVFIVTSAHVGTVDARLQARPHGAGQLHLCSSQSFEISTVTSTGPQLVLQGIDSPDSTRAVTDNSNAAAWAADWLARRGITGELVLVCGGDVGTGDMRGGHSNRLIDAFSRAVVVSIGTESGTVPEGVEGGPTRFIELLDRQLSRRAAHRVPNIDLDPTWVIPLPTLPQEDRRAEALGTLGNGLVGVRASTEEEGDGTAPLLLVNDVYTRDGHLLPGPRWTGLDRPGVDGRKTASRMLDLRGGTLVRMDPEAEGVRSMRFVSAGSPHAMALRAEASELHLESGEPLRPPVEAVGFERIRHGDVFAASTNHAGAQITVAARDHVVTAPGRRVIERMATWVAGPPDAGSTDDALERLAKIDALGFDALLAEQRSTWAHRWEDAGVVIEGDPEAELAARFAVFHLLSAAGDTGETAVGARGLTGRAYAGHVFWDADVFVLPALAALRPAAARAMLEYRIRRLPSARIAAAAGGLAGARFPWESAGDGRDVTPRTARGKHNERIAIRTGVREEHIVADVAWAAAQYATWTGDASFLDGAGRDLVVDTARYWASRIRVDADGSGHIDGVIGPDEYHQLVNDNTFTNVMARWNLRRGAELLLQSGDSEEATGWRELADRLHDGWSPERELYEQFSGYFELEPLVISTFATPPVAADVLLGAERVSGSQLIKQPDVLMLHHLVPGEVVAGSLQPCLDFYGPRTAHGSSLSPAIHASLLARAGQPEQALELFRIAARLDLDDLTGTTADGLHLATMGGVWQALAFGFVGLKVVRGTLAVNPCLPDSWRALGLTFRLGGKHVGVRAEHDRVTITCHEPVLVQIADQPPTWCQSRTAIMTSHSTTERGRP